MVHALEILDRMMTAMQTGRMRWSLLKKASYKEASELVCTYHQWRCIPGEDAFMTAFQEKFPLARTMGTGSKKKKRHGWFRRRKQKKISRAASGEGVGA
jgi:hypothetical protein